jgi:transcriptional regulator with XRE-family HTH domain
MRRLHKRLSVFIRQKRGDTPLSEFALKCGLSKATISRIENVEQNVTLDTLEHLCKVFKCNIEDLFPNDK